MTAKKDCRVKCGTHGLNLPAIACRHLREDRPAAPNFVGWIQAEFDPENREPGDLMVWCAECDRVNEDAGGWHDASEPRADFRVVCEQCFVALCTAQQRLRI